MLLDRIVSTGWTNLKRRKRRKRKNRQEKGRKQMLHRINDRREQSQPITSNHKIARLSHNKIVSQISKKTSRSKIISSRTDRNRTSRSKTDLSRIVRNKTVRSRVLL